MLIPFSKFLTQCLLGLGLGIAMSGRLRLGGALIVPIILTGLRLALSWVLLNGNLGFPSVRPIGVYFADIAAALLLILVMWIAVSINKKAASS